MTWHVLVYHLLHHFSSMKTDVLPPTSNHTTKTLCIPKHELCEREMRRNTPVRNLLDALLQLFFRGVRVQSELQPRRGTKLNHADSHLHDSGNTWMWETREKERKKEGGRERDIRTEREKENQPCLVRRLVLDRAWLRNVWTSQSCPSPRCRNHPWGRGYRWLLSTASLR